MKQMRRTAAQALAVPVLLGLLTVQFAAGPDSRGASSEAPPPPRKKLIATGWDNPDTTLFRRDYGSVEKYPFDGTVLNANGRDAASNAVSVAAGFSRVKWDPASFSNAIADLQAASPAKLTDNFVQIGANPGDVDWFDDAGWAEIAEHWRVAAKIAREGHLRGILFDPEPYTPPNDEFRYSAQANRAQHRFEEFYAKARERGRQIMLALAAENPSLTIYSYFLNSACGSVQGFGDPRPLLAGRGYGLLPPFLDGWLDVVPPTMTLVDGNEGSYHYNSEAEFLRAFVQIKADCLALVSPENRAKYRAQVQVSSGIYLDAYVNPPSSHWYIDGKGGPRVNRLLENVSAALRTADEYVWVYGEHGRWWPSPNADAKSFAPWPEALPRSAEMLALARDQLAAARQQLDELTVRGTAVNLLTNADMTEVSDKGLPRNWNTWQDEKRSHGQFALDPAVGAATKGAARASGVANGAFIQGHEASTGQRFAISARVRQQGGGHAFVRVRWQTAAETWTAEAQDVTFLPQAAGEGWAPIFGVARVPEGAGRLILLLGVTDQSSEVDQVWFDDVSLVELP